MKKAGVLLICLNIFSLFLVFNIDVVVGNSYNIGLLSERQNIVYLSSTLFLAGIMLFRFGTITKEESENLKQFSLWTILTLIISVVIIDIVLDIQTEQAKKTILKIHEAEQKAESVLALKTEIAVQSKRKILEENNKNFIDNKNGTITFKPNGLMWQKCSVGQIWTGEGCDGEAERIDWNTAVKLSDNFSGYHDWRLPTKDELMTLVFCSDNNYDSNDGSCTSMTDITKPTINLTYFSNTESGSYWSASPVPSNHGEISYVWVVYFGNGFSYMNRKNGNYFVRLVR
jgi:hypothetical protein